MSPPPLFSVVIATRDRAALFAQALASVASQQFDDFEIIVVNDGSADESRADYAQVLQQQGFARLRSFDLVRRPRGHGQSYSLNFGVDQAQGRYVCFLDDDDNWSDVQHLARAAQALQAPHLLPADLYMSNQHAWQQGRQLPGPTWIEALAGQLRLRGTRPDGAGCFEVSVADLLGCGGFCHLNTLIVRRSLYLEVGGMDENIRWECDRDLFLRLLDAGRRLLHQPVYTSRHNVPDPKLRSSMTTSLDDIERRLWQLRVLDKAAARSRDPLIRAHGHQHKGYALKRVAEALARQRDWRNASLYAAQALAVLPTIKWALFTASLYARRLLPFK